MSGDEGIVVLDGMVIGQGRMLYLAIFCFIVRSGESLRYGFTIDIMAKMMGTSCVATDWFIFSTKTRAMLGGSEGSELKRTI